MMGSVPVGSVRGHSDECERRGWAYAVEQLCREQRKEIISARGGRKPDIVPVLGNTCRPCTLYTLALPQPVKRTL